MTKKIELSARKALEAAEDLLQVANVTKHFRGVTALNDVSLEVRRGEVHAVLGRNGAGKSTLFKIISGAEHADAGTVTLAGEPVRSVHDARRLGIGMIHQELTVAPSLSAAENIFAGLLPKRLHLFVNKRQLVAQAQQMLEEVGASFDARVIVSDLSTPQRQLVEIAKAKARCASLLIMDEPTSSLGPEGVAEVLDIVREVAHRGLGVLYVSHRLDEVLAIADRVTILRDGSLVATGNASNFGVPDIVREMVGDQVPVLSGVADLQSTGYLDRAVAGGVNVRGLAGARGPEAGAVPGAATETPGEVLLEVEGLDASGLVSDVSFRLRAGEIVGLAGLVGSGRSELARALAGLDRPDRGTVRVAGKPLRAGSPPAAARAGLVYAPEERKSAGLFLDMSVLENVSIMGLAEVSSWGFLSPEREARLGRSYVDKLHIHPPNPNAKARTLSGGNQQKVVLAKQLASGARVLLLDEPTRGVDVAAKAEIYDLMREVTAQGKAVLFISSEFEELVGLCDRVMVLRRGRLEVELAREQVTLAAVMSEAVGG